MNEEEEGKLRLIMLMLATKLINEITLKGGAFCFVLTHNRLITVEVCLKQ